MNLQEDVKPSKGPFPAFESAKSSLAVLILLLYNIHFIGHFFQILLQTHGYVVYVCETNTLTSLQQSQSYHMSKRNLTEIL